LKYPSCVKDNHKTCPYDHAATKCECWCHVNRKVCKNCNHGMMLHGSVDGKGYCSEGNGNWCDCIEEGLTYEQEIELLE